MDSFFSRACAKSAREAVPGPTTTPSSKAKDPTSSKGRPTRNSKEQRDVINRVRAAFEYRDYYAVLDVPEDVAESEIKKSVQEDC